MAETDSIEDIAAPDQIEKLYIEPAPAPALELDLFGDPLPINLPQRPSGKALAFKNRQQLAELGIDPFVQLAIIGYQAQQRGDTPEAIKCYTVLMEYTHRKLAPDGAMVAQATVGPQGAAVTFAWQASP